MSPSQRARLLLHVVTVITLAAGVLVALRTPEAPSVAVTLPIRDLTPGAVDASVTQPTVGTTVCSIRYVSGWPRPAAATRRLVFASYGIARNRRRHYRIAWLIPPSLGGSNDFANLYPQSRRDPRRAETRRALRRLHADLCRGAISLDQARREATEVVPTAPEPTGSTTTTTSPETPTTTTTSPTTTTSTPTTTSPDTATTTTTTTRPPTTTTKPPSSTVPDDRRFYRATSSWNTKIPADATYRSVNGLDTGGGWLNSEQYSSPIVIAKSSDPLVTIDAPASWGWPAQTIKLHIPATGIGSTGSAGTDGNFVVVDGSTSYDFWQFNRTSTTSATVVAWAKADVVNGTGWGDKDTGRGAGIRAAGSSHLAGLIYGNELTAGIDHALGVATGKNLAAYPPVGEAISSDGCVGASGENCVLPEGARIAIPRGTAMPSSLSAQGKVLWKAMQDYGAFVVDEAPGDSHAVVFYADPVSVADADVQPLLAPGWTASDLDAIVSQLERVT